MKKEAGKGEGLSRVIKAIAGTLGGGWLNSALDVSTYENSLEHNISPYSIDNTLTRLAVPFSGLINGLANAKKLSGIDYSSLSDIEKEKYDKLSGESSTRLLLGGIGLIPGISGAAGAKPAVLGAEALAGPVAESIIAKNKIETQAAKSQDKLINAQLDAAKAQTNTLLALKSLADQLLSNDKLKMWLGIGAGALALGGAGYALYSWLRDRSEERASRTRMKMKINTPDGKDAIVDLPINNPELSDKLSDEFNRGVTRTVRRTAKYNSMKLDPETNKYIPYPEWHKKYGNLTGNPVGYTGLEYTQKAANLANMPKYNMVDMFPEKAKDSGIELTRSDKVRKFLDALDVPQEELNKIAGMHGTLKSQLSEIIGNVTAPLLAGGATTLIANKVFGRSLKDSGILGILAAGATPFIGAAAAGISPTRTPEEQEQHDINYNGWINALIPGASFFNQLLRALASKVYNDVVTNTNPVLMPPLKSVVLNKPLIAESDDFDDEDDF